MTAENESVCASGETGRDRVRRLLLAPLQAGGMRFKRGTKDEQRQLDQIADDLAYLSCMPWLDYTSINNALPGPDDCIPRITWGKIVERDGRWEMAMTLEVHHALVDGAQVGAYFAAVQDALRAI